MNDQRFNSIHLDTSPRRDDFRRARARLIGSCGSHTMCMDSDRLADAADAGPCTIIEFPGDKPHGVTFWLVDKDGLYALKPGLNSVGRMPDNDIVIADGSVSRRHCAIVVHATRGAEIHDTASKNGTFLNGKRIQGPTRLMPGDEIRMCDRSVVFQADLPPVPADEPLFAPTIG